MGNQRMTLSQLHSKAFEWQFCQNLPAVRQSQSCHEVRGPKHAAWAPAIPVGKSTRQVDEVLGPSQAEVHRAGGSGGYNPGGHTGAQGNLNHLQTQRSTQVGSLVVSCKPSLGKSAFIHKVPRGCDGAHYRDMRLGWSTQVNCMHGRSIGRACHTLVVRHSSTRLL